MHTYTLEEEDSLVPVVDLHLILLFFQPWKERKKEERNEVVKVDWGIVKLYNLLPWELGNIHTYSSINVITTFAEFHFCTH